MVKKYIQSECSEFRENIVRSLSELLFFNVVKNINPNDTSGHTRHNMNRTTPTAIYLSMLVHAKSRSKDLINQLSNLELCIDYKKLLEIQDKTIKNVCSTTTRTK